MDMPGSRLRQAYGDHISGNPAIAVLFTHKLKERNMNMHQLARRLGVDGSTVTRALSGRRMPSAELLIEMAYELGVDIDLLHKTLQRARAAGVTSGISDDDMLFERVSRRK